MATRKRIPLEVKQLATQVRQRRKYTQKVGRNPVFNFQKRSGLQSTGGPYEKPESDAHVERLMRLAGLIKTNEEPRSLSGSSLNPKMFEGLR